MPKVVYLTGAPAAGKSSTVQLLAQRVLGLQVWEYGARLTAHIRDRSTGVASQEDLRRKSAAAITPQDVREVDDSLLEFVAAHRGKVSVIIDSHAVTKEEWGFRVIPFSLSRFAELSPDEIWMLFTPPAVTIDRIRVNPSGRPTVDEEEARMHTQLQASVAATYAMGLGIPLYLFDSSGTQEDLVATLEGRLA